MLGAEGDKPAKGGQRKGKAEQTGKKAEARKRKQGPAKAAKPDQLLDALQRATTQVEEAQVEATPVEEVQVKEAQLEEQVSEPLVEPAAPLSTVSAAPEPLPEISPIAAAAPVAIAPVSLQTIANAYGDYSKKSFEQTSSFVARLAGAGSFAKAFELQTAFAREAYETFVAESCRIRELHSELAKQRLARLEGFVTKMTKPL